MFRALPQAKLVSTVVRKAGRCCARLFFRKQQDRPLSRIMQDADILPGMCGPSPGDAATGQALTADPRCDGVMFTGSTETAKLLQATLAQRLNARGQAVALIAETGGQNAMIVDSSALAEQVVADVKESLDGREEVIRSGSTRLTDLVVESFLHAIPAAQGAIFNSGSIRIDDVLPPGRVTQYDVLRIMPFGGQVMDVSLPGGLLRRVLDQGERNRGSGGRHHRQPEQQQRRRQRPGLRHRRRRRRTRGGAW